MANTDINLSPYTAESESIARRMKMAELLQQQSMQPLETPGMAGGYQLAVSPYAGLAKILQGYTAMQAGKGAEAERKALGDRYRQESMDDVMRYAQIAGQPAVAAVPGQDAYTPMAADYADREMGGAPDFRLDEQGMVPAVAPVAARIRGQIDPSMIGGFKTERMQDMALAQLLAQLAPKAPIKASAGDVFFDATGKELFRAPDKQEFGTTPHYETGSDGKTYAVYSDKQGNRKMVPATPMNQFTTGTVDAALKRDMDMYQFGNLSAEQRASLGIRLTQAGVDVARLNYETGQAPTPRQGLPANAPAPNFGVQTRPQVMPSQRVAPVPAQAMPQGMPRAAMPQGTQQPAVDVTNEPRPPGVTPKAWAEIQAEAAKSKINRTKDATAVLGLLTGVDALIDKANSSRLGNVFGGLQNVIGINSDANTADATLAVIQGALISKMPKMSGPQSDKDVDLYREMAGQIGNPNISAEAKKAAAETVRGIQKAYINGFSQEGYLPAGRGPTVTGTITGTVPPDGAVRRIR